MHKMELENLLIYLNMPMREEDDYAPEAIKAQQILRECVSAIIEYKRELKREQDSSESDSIRVQSAISLAQTLSIEITRKLMTAVEGCRLVSIDPDTVLGEFFSARDRLPSIAAQDVFTRLNRLFAGEVLIGADRMSATYAIWFAHLLTDPTLGIQRVGRCEHCGTIFTAKFAKSTSQRFCPKPATCGKDFHNKKNPPDMKHYRAEWALQEKQQALRSFCRRFFRGEDLQEVKTPRWMQAMDSWNEGNHKKWMFADASAFCQACTQAQARPRRQR